MEAPDDVTLEEVARPRVDDVAVRQLLAMVGDDGERVVDLGGTMSLNLHVIGRGLVLRVHPRFVTRDRLEGLQALRGVVASAGLTVGAPVEIGGATVFDVGGRLAEVEPYIAHTQPPPTSESYVWMFRAMGELHHAIGTEHHALAEPRVATYGTPASLAQDLAVTTGAVADDPEAADLARKAGRLLAELEAQWIDASALPNRIVHGDVRLGNVAVTPDGATAYFDFGFAAVRPRVHELAYALSWMVLRPDDSGRGEDFAWEGVHELVAAYETGAGERLETNERAALGPYLAAVPLYLASIAGFTPEPSARIREETPFLRIAEWVLAHPEAVRLR